ncbi:hypothetical protein PISL3812_01478 [Talaromyces islandicus]|uniref:Uncharacterized protein n=1 Tax=Talaromyces islandicus TaxID=28573 RepID=A0A0U1LPE1_TALIS|nr:hypothetical protein PISL3812_01478 [Talaromyces islandicus]
MTGRSETTPPGGHPGNRQTTGFAEPTAGDPYWYYEPVLDADDDDYYYDDDPSSAHIEDAITSFPRQLRNIQPQRPSPSAYGLPAIDTRPSTMSSSPVPHAQDPMTYQSSPTANNPPAGLDRRVRRRRAVAREPRAYLSSIPEDSASTAFPYTIQGSGQKIVRPLPPIPAGAGQQEQARGVGAQRSSEKTLSLPLRTKETAKEHGEGQKDK